MKTNRTKKVKASVSLDLDLTKKIGLISERVNSTFSFLLNELARTNPELPRLEKKHLTQEEIEEINSEENNND